MKNVFQHIFNKCKQYTNRMYYTCTNNTMTLHYLMLFSAVTALDRFVINKVRNNEAHITLVSSNILFKSIVFLYCFFTGTKLLMISPKFTLSEIVNTILSNRGTNILFVDKEILSDIERMELDEGIGILQFFNCVETTLKMTEILLEKSNVDTSLTKVSRRGRVKYILGIIPNVGILSPGTVSNSCITKTPYKLLGKSMLALSYFMGLKPTDKVSVIADFEFYPGIYTILGLLNGIQFVLPETDTDLASGEELKDMLDQSNHKPNVIFISSNNFKKLWDTIILKVYSKKCMFTLAKYWLTKWIINYMIRKELRNILGKQVQKVHILNEELGFYVLDVLKHSKIMFSSSYGFLEEGNFLAFKDPELFKHKDYIYKPGGTLIKDSESNVVINEEDGFVSSTNLSVGEIGVVNEGSLQVITSGDVGLLIPNISNQGDRKYLYVYGRKMRHLTSINTHGIKISAFVTNQPSLDMIEKSIKDTWLIRDCFLHRHLMTNGGYSYELFVEIRDELIDSKRISWKEVEDTIKILAEELNKNSVTKVNHFGIVSLNGMRNVAGKLQYYNI